MIVDKQTEPIQADTKIGRGFCYRKIGLTEIFCHANPPFLTQSYVSSVDETALYCFTIYMSENLLEKSVHIINLEAFQQHNILEKRPSTSADW